MPIIKNISNYTPNMCKLGTGEHCNPPLAPFTKITATAPDLASLLADEHSSIYSADNIETMIQALERRQAEQLPPDDGEEAPAPAPRRKKSETPSTE